MRGGVEEVFRVIIWPEHFRGCCNVGIVASHPSRKSKGAARVGHPAGAEPRDFIGHSGLTCGAVGNQSGRRKIGVGLHLT
jgi:hypothetical protein